MLTDEMRNEIIRLLNLGSPFFASLAATRILALKPNGKVELAMQLELVDRWLRDFRIMLEYKHRVEDAVLPTIEALFADLKGPNADDDFLAPIMKAEGESTAKQSSVRPSRVPQPGPLENLWFPQSEDEFRHAIIAWNNDKEDGRREPLFFFGREPFWGYGLRQRYLTRSINRSWVGTKLWEPDLAIVEDVLLVFCYLQGKLTTVSRNVKAMTAEPLTRKYTVHDCRLAGRRAVWKLEREGLLTKIKPQTWALTPKGEAAVKEIIAIWGNDDKPAEG